MHPKPTDAEREAAEQSIHIKTTEAFGQAKTEAVKSIMVFVFFVLMSVPFMAGMPLNQFFRPWGQLSLIGCALAFGWVLLAGSNLLSTWSFKRSVEKLVSSLHDEE